ncbi:MAG: hypothetical protein DRI44_03275 [Chlamydiae bacterium]|nr:MAG: hypothetical protein DRI44_03275 [Chlamydiota bacterium]
MNYDIIITNLEQASQALQDTILKIQKQKNILDDETIEDEFEVNLQHIYHHLNVAWNARRASIQKYRNMKDADFNEWSKYPLLEPYSMEEINPLS